MGFIKHVNFKWLLALVLISVSWVNLNHERWLTKNVIEQDIVNYYAYLPALFIENDLSLAFLNNPSHAGKTGAYWPQRAPNGKFVIKMSMGMALTYLPFFGMAHGYAKLFNYPATGFSEPYQFAILFSSLFYFLIGLYYLRKTLILFFSERVSLLTLFCLCFGTNVFYYLTLGGGLAHAVDFSLMAVFLFYAIAWRRNGQAKQALVLGVIGGLMVLVRPINVLVFLFLFIYCLPSIKANEPAKLKQVFLHYVLMLLLVFFIFMPQLFYWKYTSGQYVFNSYIGEHFYFTNPHVFNGLFSFRKGWLVYTPIMVFALAGFFYLKGEAKQLRAALILFFLVYIYACFSWWCWWYGGSFGQRALIDIYPLLAMPFAACIVHVSNRQKVFKWVTYAVISFLILLNLFQTMQAKYNIIHYDSMTAANYFEVFFTTTKKPDREKYLKHPDYEKALRGENEY